MKGGPQRVFLLPCIFGDEPSLANLRSTLADRIAFELLDYPDIDRPSREIRDFDHIVRRTVERISTSQPSGDVQIAGYSFGGLVGFAAAHQLQAKGRRVGRLAIMDSRALSLKMPNSVQLTRNRDAAPGAWGTAGDIVSRVLIAAGLSEIVRAAIGPVGRIFGTGASNGLRRLFLQNLRGRALSGLTLGRLDIPLILFRARDQGFPDLPADLGWSVHCSAVRCVTLDGDHNSMFRSEHLPANAQRISLEMTASSRPTESRRASRLSSNNC